MEKKRKVAGLLYNDIPFNRMGHGPRILLIFQGIGNIENKPLPARLNWIYENYYKYLEEEYTTYLVLPKHGLPKGYTLKNMADDYAKMIKIEFGGPVDIIGVSTGGSIAQHFAADHSDLVRKLIIHSSAYKLSDATKKVQIKARDMACLHRWRSVYAALFGPIFSQNGNDGFQRELKSLLGSFIIELFMDVLFGLPKDASDFIITINAEDKHDFKTRLNEIISPTLVVAGKKDPYYSEALFRETAEGIPNAKLMLYDGMGHPAGGNQFHQDVLTFLKEDITKINT